MALGLEWNMRMSLTIHSPLLWRTYSGIVWKADFLFCFFILKAKIVHCEQTPVLLVWVPFGYVIHNVGWSITSIPAREMEFVPGKWLLFRTFPGVEFRNFPFQQISREMFLTIPLAGIGWKTSFPTNEIYIPGTNYPKVSNFCLENFTFRYPLFQSVKMETQGSIA